MINASSVYSDNSCFADYVNITGSTTGSYSRYTKNAKGEGAGIDNNLENNDTNVFFIHSYIFVSVCPLESKRIFLLPKFLLQNFESKSVICMLGIVRVLRKSDTRGICASTSR